MKKQFMRIISYILVVCMVLTFFPTTPTVSAAPSWSEILEELKEVNQPGFIHYVVRHNTQIWLRKQAD